jgi:hypothetical protein
MQKPKFRTVEKSAWLFVTTRLHPQAPRKLDKRTATRSGYLSTAAAILNVAESTLETPFVGESMRKYVERFRAAAASRA